MGGGQDPHLKTAVICLKSLQIRWVHKSSCEPSQNEQNKRKSRTNCYVLKRYSHTFKVEVGLGIMLKSKFILRDDKKKCTIWEHVPNFLTPPFHLTTLWEHKSLGNLYFLRPLR